MFDVDDTRHFLLFTVTWEAKTPLHFGCAETEEILSPCCIGNEHSYYSFLVDRRRCHVGSTPTPIRLSSKVSTLVLSFINSSQVVVMKQETWEPWWLVTVTRSFPVVNTFLTGAWQFWRKQRLLEEVETCWFIETSFPHKPLSFNRIQNFLSCPFSIDF
jgi:hypothetical protein